MLTICVQLIFVGTHLIIICNSIISHIFIVFKQIKKHDKSHPLSQAAQLIISQPFLTILI